MSASGLIIDRQMPVYDVTIIEHLVVHADPESTLRAAETLDFMTVRTPLIEAAMWARGLPDRIRGRALPAPARLTLAQGGSLPGWLVFGSSDGEVAFGAVGKFWKGSIEWRDTRLEDFASFAEPGWGKIACNFSVRGYGGDRTLLSYECRTVTTDGTSRRRFLRYWTGVRPFVVHIMRATLRAIAMRLEQPQPQPQPPESAR